MKSVVVTGGSGKLGRPGLDQLARARKLEIVTFRDWKKIDEAEIARPQAVHVGLAVEPVVALAAHGRGQQAL